MYTNSTIPFPLLFKNAIRNSLSQKLLPKNWFGNGKLEKNGAIFWQQPFLRKAQAKKKKKSLCRQCARTSSIKKTQLEVFYKKKMAPKVVRRERFFRFQKRCEVGLQSLEAFFFLQRTAKTRQIVVKIFQDQ